MRLLKYLKYYKKETVLAPLFKMLEAMFELMVPLVVAHMIDYGIAGADRGILYRSVALLILLCAVGFSAAVSAQYFSAKSITFPNSFEGYTLCSPCTRGRRRVCCHSAYMTFSIMFLNCSIR